MDLFKRIELAVILNKWFGDKSQNDFVVLVNFSNGQYSQLIEVLMQDVVEGPVENVTMIRSRQNKKHVSL